MKYLKSLLTLAVLTLFFNCETEELSPQVATTIRQ